MHKALQQMNLKRTQVVSALTGVTGMAIIKAIIAGERNPPRLAQLRNPHWHHDTDDIAKALQGNGRAEHLCALRQAVELLCSLSPADDPRRPADQNASGALWRYK